MAYRLKKSYLVAYNFASAIAWAAVLGLVIKALLLGGPPAVHLSVSNFTRVTQTFALLEVLHSLFGLSISLSPVSPRLGNWVTGLQVELVQQD